MTDKWTESHAEMTHLYAHTAWQLYLVGLSKAFGDKKSAKCHLCLWKWLPYVCMYLFGQHEKPFRLCLHLVVSQIGITITNVASQLVISPKPSLKRHSRFGKCFMRRVISDAEREKEEIEKRKNIYSSPSIPHSVIQLVDPHIGTALAYCKAWTVACLSLRQSNLATGSEIDMQQRGAKIK